MEWIEVEIRTDPSLVDLVTYELSELGVDTVTIDDYREIEAFIEEKKEWVLAEEDLVSNEKDILVHAFFPKDEALPETLESLDEKLKDLLKENPSGKADWRVLGEQEERDWSEEWKKHYKPLKIGRRVVVIPKWEETQLEKGQIGIRIDPGLAFGTGSHETTSLCLQALEAMAPLSTVADLGCGSGILSIAAVQFGAREVLAMDIDPLSITATEENAKLNGIEEGLRVLLGDATEGPQGQFDLVIANILLSVLEKLLPKVDQWLVPGGELLCSGILCSQVEALLHLLEKHGLDFVECLTEGEWAAVRARAPHA